MGRVNRPPSTDLAGEATSGGTPQPCDRTPRNSAPRLESANGFETKTWKYEPGGALNKRHGVWLVFNAACVRGERYADWSADRWLVRVPDSRMLRAE